MPRHNPTIATADDGHGRHERRLALDTRARTRRRARRVASVTPDGFGRQRVVLRGRQDEREVAQQVAEWKDEVLAG